MERVASRELRNNTAGVLRQVENGRALIITVNGRPAAQIGPVTDSRRRWIQRDDLARRLRVAQTDPGLREDLARLVGDMTDDLDS